MKAHGFLYILCIVLLLSGCGSPLHRLLLEDQEHLKLHDATLSLDSRHHNEATSATLHYLGVGGLVLEVSGRRVMTAPFYSNPPFWRNFPGIPIHSNTERINALFPKLLRDAGAGDPGTIKTILVGHSHYDHLLDVPYLMQNHLRESRLIGSETAVAMINKKLGLPCLTDGPRTLVAQANVWMPMGDNVYVYPIPSSHAPHVFGVTAQKGNYQCTDNFKLRTAWDWKMGGVHSYLIDFRDESGNVQLRVYYQDSASDPGQGAVPKKVREERGIDLAILVLAGFSKAGDYPKSVIKDTDATLFVVSHWEDFFRQFEEPPRVAPFSNQLEFVERLENTLNKDQQWVMTLPGRTLQLEFKSLPGNN